MCSYYNKNKHIKFAVLKISKVAVVVSLLLALFTLSACKNESKEATVFLPTSLENSEVKIEYNDDGTIARVSNTDQGLNELEASFEYNTYDRTIEVLVTFDGEDDQPFLFSYSCDAKGRPWRGTVCDPVTGVLGWHLDHTYSEETGELIEIQITPGAYVIENHIANWDEGDWINFDYGDNSDGQLGYDEVYDDSNSIEYDYDSVYTITANYNRSSGKYSDQVEDYTVVMTEFTQDENCVYDLMSILSILDATSLVYSAG